MKKITLLIASILFLFAGSLSAQEEDKSKRPSPPAIAEGKIGDVNIKIDYSTPAVKGRTIYGELIPYGEVWRAGANEATKISFDQDVKIGGKKLKAGEYAFFVIPKAEGNWEIIFNSQADQWGAYNRNPELDVLKAEASTFQIKPVERLKYHIKDGMIHLDWSTSRLSFAVN